MNLFHNKVSLHCFFLHKQKTICHIHLPTPSRVLCALTKYYKASLIFPLLLMNIILYLKRISSSLIQRNPWYTNEEQPLNFIYMFLMGLYKNCIYIYPYIPIEMFLQCHCFVRISSDLIGSVFFYQSAPLISE